MRIYSIKANKVNNRKPHKGTIHSAVIFTSCVSNPVFLVRVSDGTEGTSILCFCSSSLTWSERNESFSLSLSLNWTSHTHSTPALWLKVRLTELRQTQVLITLSSTTPGISLHSIYITSTYFHYVHTNRSGYFCAFVSTTVFHAHLSIAVLIIARMVTNG